MNNYRKYIKLFLMSLFVAVLAGIPQSAKADMGPKPTAEFDFVYETGADLEIEEAYLMQCKTDVCLDPHPLEELGPQGFSCNDGRCTSMAYGYAQYMYLEITFSDGITRESNVFSKDHFDALYEVTVNADGMQVEETGGQMNEMLKPILLSFGIICLVGLLLVAAVVLLIIWIIRMIRKK